MSTWGGEVSILMFDFAEVAREAAPNRAILLVVRQLTDVTVKVKDTLSRREWAGSISSVDIT